MTGVEAISNGIPAFEPPEPDNAAKTLLIMARRVCGGDQARLGSMGKRRHA